MAGKRRYALAKKSIKKIICPATPITFSMDREESLCITHDDVTIATTTTIAS
ncbi:hypothetical protein ACLOJK_003906 [Asimina triloba]